MENQNIKTVETKRGTLRYYRDWENYDGGVVMLNPQTINRYKELIKERNEVDITKFDCFFAFSDKQFNEGLKKIRPLKEGEKLVPLCGGGFATKDGVERLSAYYKSVDDKIRQECDPQEVYFYEYNNFECMISWDGDEEAINLVESYFGSDIAKSIVRI